MSKEGLYHTLVMAQMGQKEVEHEYSSGGEALGAGYIIIFYFHLFLI